MWKVRVMPRLFPSVLPCRGDADVPQVGESVDDSDDGQQSDGDANA